MKPSKCPSTPYNSSLSPESATLTFSFCQDSFSVFGLGKDFSPLKYSAFNCQRMREDVPPFHRFFPLTR